jgi:hypothetical protein
MSLVAMVVQFRFLLQMTTILRVRKRLLRLLLSIRRLFLPLPLLLPSISILLRLLEAPAPRSSEPLLRKLLLSLSRRFVLLILYPLHATIFQAFPAISLVDIMTIMLLFFLRISSTLFRVRTIFLLLPLPLPSISIPPLPRLLEALAVQPLRLPLRKLLFSSSGGIVRPHKFVLPSLELRILTVVVQIPNVLVSSSCL